MADQLVRSSNGDRTVSGLVARLRAGYYFGNLAAGDRLPSVRELAKQLRISPTTALDLYKQLEAQGFVEGRERSGTFLRRVGLEAIPGAREKALFNVLSCTTSKLELLGVSVAEFARLLALYTGAVPRADFTFGVLAHAESFESIDRQLQRRLKFRLPLVPLPPDDTRRAEARAQLARNRSIRCLLSTYLFASRAFDLAREHQIPMIVVRLAASTARAFESPDEGLRYVILRDRDCAEDYRLVVRTTAGSRVPRIVVTSVDDADGMAVIDRDATEVYASPLSEEQVRARYGSTKTVKTLPSEVSQQTIDEILFHYVFTQ